jgi:hypothetical protein
MVLGAVSGIKTSSLRSSLGKGGQSGTDHGVTEPPLVLVPRTKHRHGSLAISSEFRPRTTWEAGHRPDSPALHPLQLLQPCIPPEQHRLHAWLTLLRSDGRKLARQSENVVRARKK